MGVGPKIFGDGSSSRCYTYVKDVTGIIAKCIGRTDNLTLNVGSEKTTSIKELYEEIKKASGLNVEAQYVPERSRDVEKNSVDHTLTKELFDYEETPFDEIIADTWEWVDKQPMVMPKMKEKEIV
jgi:nucleoside-diphosphate-sugar epimerase